MKKAIAKVGCLVIFLNLNSCQFSIASEIQKIVSRKNLHPTEIPVKNRYPYHNRFQWTIDRPIRDVWPIFYDVRRWVKRYRVEVISGSDPMEVGAVSKAIPLYVKDSSMFYLMRVVSVVPEKSILVWLTLPDAKDPEGSFTQFYYWQLTEANGKTTVTIEAFGESVVSSSKEWIGGIGSYGDESWPSYLKYLEKLVLEP